MLARRSIRRALLAASIAAPLAATLAASLAASLAACGSDARRRPDSARAAAADSGAAAPRDDFGDSVLVPTAAEAARARIVSLNPTTTELLFAVGAGPRLVGRTHWDAWPDSARLVPDLGDGLRPNVEAVLTARPTLVVLYASEDNRAAAGRFRAAGVATLSLKLDRIEQLRRGATLLAAAALGDGARGRFVADTVAASLERVRGATAALPRPTVFWHVWDHPLITIGGGSYMNELVEIAGGRNVYGALPDVSPQIAMEDLLRRDPDVILAGPEGRRTILADPAWRPLRAVREGRVLVVDTSLVGRPSVRLGEAARALATLLHPEAATGAAARPATRPATGGAR
ncbi:MAG: ABC transporter substrate-binding protein [Gemmatimonadaceae bacterium]